MPSAPAPVIAPRRKTRKIKVGKLAIGGDAPITVQSMTTTPTSDINATLQQIAELTAAGCDIVRCTCNDLAAAEGLAQIVPRSPVPIVADIHHQYKMALAALEAGVACLRLNPGNIRKPEHIKLVASECRDRGVPIRIGVNGGSLDPELYEKYGGKVTPEAMVESAMQELAYFDEVGFDNVKISVKASNVPLMIEAYRQLADATQAPLHLGVTEAGPGSAGLLSAEGWQRLRTEVLDAIGQGLAQRTGGAAFGGNGMGMGQGGLHAGVLLSAFHKGIFKGAIQEAYWVAQAAKRFSSVSAVQLPPIGPLPKPTAISMAR